MNNLHPQIPLSFRPKDTLTFENFVTGANQDVVEALYSQLTTPDMPLLYLWGAEGSGCSHLLQAACHRASQLQRTAIYLPLDELCHFEPAILEGIDAMELVCLDHLQAIAGLGDWEEALFHLFNRMLEQQSALLVAATQPPRGVGLQLADLQSRLASCAVFKVSGLDDANKVRLLKDRAADKGLELNDEAAHYILNRSDRSLEALLKNLDFLDRSSLSAGRRLTIPFIKQAMNW
ncbi:MAG: DnaA regulatory inactivator Hda [Pseudomonadales bacterium]|jgi:DnaA family protein